jgi:2-polyprenyl-3-methyl-5-hydroxy-6-metoxy-1,4-benzoquinol methylase
LTLASFDKYTRSGAYHWRQVSPSLRWHSAYVAGRYQAAVKAALPVAGKRVLDVGCGDGVLSSMLVGQGARVSGIDLDLTGVSLARDILRQHHGEQVSLLQASGLTLPFAAGVFDAVVCTEVIEHVDAPETLLQEIARVLVAGGKAVLTTPCRVSEYPQDPQHVQEFFPDQMKALVAPYFGEVEIRLSHALALYELYLLQIPGLRRPLFRYLINLASILGYNPFFLSNFKIYTQMIVVARKV